MSITYRSTKGSNLTHTELDTNFYEPEEAAIALEDAKLEPAEIDEVELDNDKLTITLSDGIVHGPMTLPSSKLSYRGKFKSLYPYQSGDIIYTSTNLYLVLKGFISGARFNPNDELDGTKVVVAVGGTPVCIDVPMFFPGVPKMGMIGQYSVTRDLTFRGAYAYHRIAPEAQVVYLLKINNETVGSITFEADAYTGTVDTSTELLELATGDIVSLHNSVYTEGKDLSITLLFRRVA